LLFLTTTTLSPGYAGPSSFRWKRMWIHPWVKKRIYTWNVHKFSWTQLHSCSVLVVRPKLSKISLGIPWIVVTHIHENIRSKIIVQEIRLVLVEWPTIANQINALAQVGGIPIRSFVFIAEQRLQVPYI
jgi:hypothetical protein